MSDTSVNRKLGITFTAAQAWSLIRLTVGGVLIVVAGYAAWDDAMDGIKANADEIKRNDARTDSLRSFVISQNTLQDREIEDLSENVDEAEDRLNQIDRLLIQRDGDLATQIQRLEIQQQNQAEVLGEIRDLLRQARD